ncbi:MAG: efflux RND transporter periplasmic adaptor subunit [Pseudomonadales bacterium]|nr:efflux RND transporter periplasmic adaptor subunit [Pseudomonadales bacterium]
MNSTVRIAFSLLLLLDVSLVQAATELQTHTVALRKTALERMLDGTVEAVNQGTVSAQTSGRVAEVLVDVNDYVPAGTVIVRLTATEQKAGLGQAEAALREAEAALKEVRKRHDRIVDLMARRLVSQQQVDQVAAERDAVAARVASARAAVDSARQGVRYTEVHAPYAGIVTRRHVEVGETVAPGTLLMSGLSLQYLRVSVDLPQRIVASVRTLNQALVYVDDKPIPVEKITIFPEANAGSNTFRTRLDLPENAGDLYPGMLVKVGFVVGDTERVLIPASALVERSEITAVYVVGEGDTESLRLRQVRVGHRFGDELEVLAGLRAGEVIATDPVTAVGQLAMRHE